MPRLPLRDVDWYISARASFQSTTGNLRGVRYAVGYTGQLSENHADAYRSAGQEIDYTVISYRTPIAWHTRSDGWVVPEVKYSQTTTRHQHIARMAIGGQREADHQRPIENGREAMSRVIARRPQRQAERERIPTSADLLARIDEALSRLDDQVPYAVEAERHAQDDFHPDNGAPVNYWGPGYTHSGESAIYSLEYLQAKYNRTQA